ncbi:MAG: hypothetical protein WBA97_30430 [Actinophytocola sp.]|uniref:thiolase family protein n=1 Tax=Actinophytocola sp. TaxID=1872138 RepID=UPI003C748DF7
MTAFLYDAVRTPFGRFDGGLAKERPDDLAATVLAAIADRTPGLAPADVDEVTFGLANGAGEDNRNVGPLGASGGRILGTLAKVLREGGHRWGVAAICIGVGQGLAVVLENVA